MMKKAIERFEKKIIKTNDCWFWTASKTKQGYGMFSYEGKSIPAHRLRTSHLKEKLILIKLYIKHATTHIA